MNQRIHPARRYLRMRAQVRFAIEERMWIRPMAARLRKMH